MALLRGHSLVVAVAHIIGDGFIEPLLSGMAILPCNGVKPGHPRLKEWLTFRIDRGALFGANYKGSHAVAVDAVFIGEEIGRAHVCTPVTNAHLVCRLLLENKKQTNKVKQH